MESSDAAENIVNNDATNEKPIVDEQTGENEGLLASIFSEIFYNPLNLLLVVIIAILIYKIIKGRFEEPQKSQAPKEPKLPKMKKRDFTVKELREYDGTGPDGRILMAINGSVYDVTAGRRFYGPGGPYAAFGGRDASRGLATFKVVANEDDEYDDLSDLNTVEMSVVKEWEMQLKERYDYVGKLLKPGEAPTNYSDEDDEPITKSNEDDKIDDIGTKETKNEEPTTASTSTNSTETVGATENSSNIQNKTTSSEATNAETEVRKRITTPED